MPALEIDSLPAAIVGRGPFQYPVFTQVVATSCLSGETGVTRPIRSGEKQQKETAMKRRPSRRCAPVAPLLQGLENRLLLASGPDLALSIMEVNYAYQPSVPGDKGTVTLFLENVGDQAATGSISIEVRGSTDTTFDSSDLLLGSMQGKGSLAAGDDFDMTIKLVLPSTTTPGDYYMVVKVTSTLSTPDLNTANDTDASVETGEVMWAFGNVGTRKNVKLKVDDGTGLVTFALTGPGTGVVAPPSGPGVNFDSVTLTGTTIASNLKISTTRKNLTKIDTISVLDDAPPGSPLTGSIKSIQAKNVDLETGLLVDGLLGSLTLHDISSILHYITLNAGPVAVPDKASVKLTVHTINACTIDTGGIPIKSFTAAQVTGADITAPWIGSLNVKSKVLGEGNFSGNLTLDGPDGNNGVSLAKFQVFGAMDNTYITASSDVKSIAAAQWESGKVDADDVGKITIKGSMDADITTDGLTSVNVTGDCSGTWNALWIGKAQVGGDLQNTTWNLDLLGKLTVKGWMSSANILADLAVVMVTVGGMQNSSIFAGVHTLDMPIDSNGFDTTDLGAIGTVLVKGLKDASKQWLDSFINSDIAAWTISKITLANMHQDDLGNYFGVTAHEIATYTLKQDGAVLKADSGLGTDNPLDPTQDLHIIGDYRVRIVNGA